MIATNIGRKTDYIELVKQFIDESATLPECLILTHNNPVLIERLDDAFADQVAVILDVPQSQWSLGEGCLVDAVAWAITEGGIKHLIVVGDSSAMSKVESTLRATSAGRVSDPLARAKAVNASRQAATDQFKQQLMQLGGTPQFVDAISSGDLQLTVLFYRAEAGVFATYDGKTDAFQLLN